MITLKDLAKELDLSVSTVSKALNNSYEISQATIARVQKLAKDYNYKRNKAAVSLKKSSTKTIGVIIPDILNHFFAKSLHGIEKEASKRGYSIITCISNESCESEKNSIELLANGSVDGFIISVAEETQKSGNIEHIENLNRQRMPLVMFDRTLNNVNCDKVIIDNYGAAYKGTQKLLKESRKKIVLLTTLEGLNVGEQRKKGYKEAIEGDEKYKEKPIIISFSKSSDIEKQVEEIFKKHKNIDGILSIDNTSGVIALNKAKKNGYDIPKEISIIGFSDSNILPFTNPKLSTVSEHANEIGKNAVQMIIEKIEEKKFNTKEIKVIKTNLELRETTLKS